MKKVIKEVPAKLNLTLDVGAEKNGYHQIKSLVTSVDIFDTVTVNKRTDGKITLSVKGMQVPCLPHENNAFKAASLFMQNFPTTGVDIVINKRIPIGGGLGGSSADIAGVLIAMKELYETEMEVCDLASKLGSDAAYMTKGGFAIMSGRGEKVAPVNSQRKFYLLFITSDKKISAAEAYKAFDQESRKKKGTTAQAERSLLANDLDLFFQLIKNDLELAAKKLVPEVDFNLKCLKKAGARAVSVAGSGPTVYGIFETEKERNESYKKLKLLFGESLIKAETIPSNEDDR